MQGEDLYVNEVVRIAQEVLPDQYVVKPKANLYYQITIDNELNVVVDPKRPMRGKSAFQTDLCIFMKKDKLLVPRVAIEFKQHITTHDIITYSNKARRHKHVYPYLRYGLISYQISEIPKRFFIHNESLDFYLTLEHYKNSLPEVIKDLITEELKMSVVLESTIFGEKSCDFFRTKVEFKNLGG